MRDLASDTIIGTTRYHDIVASIDRVEIGYTFYGASWQRTHVNTTCKLLLLEHAFDVLHMLRGCWSSHRQLQFPLTARHRSTGGEERRGHLDTTHPRRDGTARDSVMYSILADDSGETSGGTSRPG